MNGKTCELEIPKEAQVESDTTAPDYKSLLLLLGLSLRRLRDDIAERKAMGLSMNDLFVAYITDRLDGRLVEDSLSDLLREYDQRQKSQKVAAEVEPEP